jgi:hypothetical protein
MPRNNSEDGRSTFYAGIKILNSLLDWGLANLMKENTQLLAAVGILKYPLLCLQNF